MPKAYSNDLKWRIMYMYINGYPQAKISQLFYVSTGLVSKVLSLYRKWGCVKNPFQGQCGQRKALNAGELAVRICERCNQFEVYLS